ncbi:hypothetical protein BVIRIDIS_20240 [Blastochloris viridis]|uniref:Outer membrane beta-barrel protein n=1 Tax=Blastochloris viridis TaxID=1079 RepID=A0A0S4Q5Q5_BLAVI|nr:hypothetical protein BVIRIDIS_20240 [Blastochloris viridis]
MRVPGLADPSLFPAGTEEAAAEGRQPPNRPRLRPSIDADAPGGTTAAARSGPGTTGSSSTGRTPPAARRVPEPLLPGGRPQRPNWRQNARAYDAAIQAADGRRDRVEAARNDVLRVSPIETTEPFDPVGIRVGSFVLRPAFDSVLGYDDNPLRVATGRRPSLFQRFGGAMLLRSDWSRHALDADIRGSYTKYDDVSGNNRPELDARLRGRVDITERTRTELEGRYLLTTESAGDPDAPTGAVRPPPVITIGGTAGLVHSWNRLEVALRGAFDRTTYDNAKLRNGSILDRSDRNYDQPAATLRVGYDIRPGLRPFVEGRIDSRNFEREVDTSGYIRQSDGQQIRAGTSFEVTRTLTGEAATGWIVRRYEDPRLPDISGLLIDGSLVWTASGLTTVRFIAITSIDETSYEDTTGVLRRDLGLSVDHAFRRWLIGTARFGWGFDDYGQSGRRDDRFTMSGLITAKLSRDLWLTGEVRQERLSSNEPSNDYTANIMLVGLRLQR